MTGINIDITPGLTQDTTHVQHSGSQPLSERLGGGGVVAAMDEWLAQRHDNTPYEWQWDPAIGALPAVAIPLATTTSLDLTPDSYGQRVWDNLRGAAPQTFSVSLDHQLTLTTEVSWETKLSISDTLTAQIGVSGGPIKAGGSNAITVSAEIGHTTSHTETVTIGTTDSSTGTLPPGTAELVVLCALTGPLIITTQVQTAWQGHWLWRHRDKGESWRPFAASTVMDHGLARPYDPHGTHSGLTTLTARIGAAGEVTQQVVSLTDVSPQAIQDALARALSVYSPTEMVTIRGQHR